MTAGQGGRPAENDAPRVICWDENGGLYLPPEYAHIGVAMDRRDAADEIQRAFDGARRGRVECRPSCLALEECSRDVPPASTAPERDRAAEVEAAEDRAEQAAFDVSRERA